MLKTNALINDPVYEESINIGIETILGLWEFTREKRPYLFKMGTNFRKLKVPLIWYDILHVLDVLSQYKQACSDPRFQSMLNIVRSKADPDFRFTSESIWTKMERMGVLSKAGTVNVGYIFRLANS